MGTLITSAYAYAHLQGGCQITPWEDDILKNISVSIVLFKV